MEQERFSHTCYPIYDSDCKALILGTFPSIKSRETKFYYGHPQNRFWRVMAGICGEEVPLTKEGKKELLLRNHIALWDVIESCEVTGSADSSIKNVIPNDISLILNACPIRAIYGNGATAVKLYQRYLYRQTGRKIIGLPSTSPANARFSLDDLILQWKQIMDGIKQ